MIRRLSGFLGIIFHRMPIERILRSENKKCLYCDIQKDDLKDLVLTYAPEHGETDVDMLIKEMLSQVPENAFNIFAPAHSQRINVFSLLFYYIREILLFYENEVVCRYQKLLEWNELIRDMGQDLPIAAYLAYEDSISHVERKDYYWKPVIGQNNMYLLRMLKKGMAENHFHLRGSSSYFDISWINLMNYPGNTGYMNELRRIEKNLRNKKRKTDIGSRKMSLRHIAKVAALIRLYLSSKMNEEVWGFMRERMKLAELEGLLKTSEEHLEMNVSELVNWIEVVHWGSMEPDYMLRYVERPKRDKDRELWILSGERWFLYQMLRRIMSEDRRFSKYEYNLFYAYVRIKNELRAEFIQGNDISGFDNFQIYQARKDLISHHGDWGAAEGLLARLAIRNVLSDPAIKHLEVRISPNATAEEIMRDIRGYDSAVLDPIDPEERRRMEIAELAAKRNVGQAAFRLIQDEREALRSRFHYVLHFTKREDKQEGEARFLECRHYAYRKKLERIGKEIIKCRTVYPEYANRIVGIDACSKEIGCRPEVFGKVFRTLRNYMPPEPGYYVGKQPKVRQLRFTYHVAEDFLDIVDGLRAINEAIRYLAFNCGDRLGHVLALGVDPIAWYRKRDNSVTLPLQDDRENCVWLHHYLNKFGIENMSPLKGWLEERFRQYFEYVYQPFIPFVRDLRGMEGFDKEGDDRLYYVNEYFSQMSKNGFDLNVYYLAWLLRGDEPHLYVTGKFKKEGDYDHWSRYSINATHIRKQDIRNIPAVALIYSMYHYNNMVKERGSEVRTFELHRDYPKAVASVQKEMRKDIMRRGIGIETNPSSNYKIGAFEKYSELPIKALYNIGLVNDSEELSECAQMNVSINTDDQGVFNTRLENEYALVAASMEKEITQDGRPSYSRQNINRWLDNIREMGLRQSFDYDIGES